VQGALFFRHAHTLGHGSDTAAQAIGKGGWPATTNPQTRKITTVKPQDVEIGRWGILGFYRFSFTGLTDTPEPPKPHRTAPTKNHRPAQRGTAAENVKPENEP